MFVKHNELIDYVRHSELDSESNHSKPKNK